VHSTGELQWVLGAPAVNVQVPDKHVPQPPQSLVQQYPSREQ
jgi:hypothetical protein